MKTRTTSTLIAIAAFAALPWQAQAAFTNVEDFNARTVGALGGQNGWVVTTGDTTTSTVVVDPDNPINKILKHTGGNDASKVLPAPIPDAAVGTLFYRVRLISTSNDVSAGLSDENPPSLTNFGTFEVQPNYSGSFRARDGGTNRTVFTMVAGAWYKLWVVADTTADTYRLYIQSDGDATYATQTELVSSDGTWNFRNAAAANPLQAFVIMSNSSNTNLYFDDLYVDTAGSNLADPTYVANPDTDADGMNDAWEAFYFTDLSRDGTGDFDSDGMTDLAEYTANTLPNDSDTDDDGLTDGQETTGSANTAFGNAPTNPKDADSDDDGTSDGAEVAGTLNTAFGNAPTNPNAADSDGDSWSDSVEFTYSTDPNTSTSLPVVHELIGLVKRNGSFEYRDGVPNPTNFKQGWDGSGGTNDIDAWSTWTEQTTTSTDSGVETGNATDGSLKGFCQSGNGAKNMTTYLGKAGDIIRLTYDRVNGYTTGNTYLLYDGTDLGAGFVQIPTSTAQTLTPNGSYAIAFKIPAGSPAVGRAIGVGIKSTGSWPGWDKVVLTVQDQDADADGLSDFWEDQWFGNNDENPTPMELALQDNTGDPDGDTYDNASEFAAGTDPTTNASIPGDSDADGLADTWEVDNFGSLAAQDGTGDPDHDYATNLQEYNFGSSTNPMDASSWPDTDGDTLNDGWEIAWFTDLATGDVDSDGDGFTNSAEMAAGSSPTDATWTPLAAKLAHRWSFTGSLGDSAGTSDATIVEVGDNNATLGATSVTLAGGDKAASDYVSLGTNLLQGKMTPVTIELWATQHSVQNYSRIFDFGTDTNENLFMSWTLGTNAASDRVGWKDGAENLSDGTNAPYVLDTEYHIVMTLDPAFNTGGELMAGTRVTWYSTPAGSGHPLGSPQGTFNVAHHLATFADVNDWLGRSQWGDATANATFNEVRIWDGALTAAAREALQAAGPDNASLADSDADGLIDAWETTYFGDLTQAADGDPDADGATNTDEQTAGSRPNSLASTPADADGDGLLDTWEMTNFGGLYHPDGDPGDDPDGDFDTNLVELTNDTNPNLKSSFYSSTSDTVPDSWKAFHGISDQTGASDLDEGTGDGSTNEQEFYAGTNPTLADTDGDGLNDGAESTATTNPLDPDTDDDGLTDGAEVHTYTSNPLAVDTDGDTFTDGYEVAQGSSPTNPASTPAQPAGFTKIEDFEGSGMNLGQTFNGVNGWLADAQNVVVANPDGTGQSGHWVGGAMRKSLTHHALQVLDGHTGTLFLQVYLPGGDPNLIDHSLSLSDTTGTGTGDHEAQTGFINGSHTVRNGGGNYDGGWDFAMGEWVNIWVVANNSSDTIRVFVESPSNGSGQVCLNTEQDGSPAGETPCAFRNGVASNALIQILFLEFDTDGMIIDNIYVDPTAENLANPVAVNPDTDADNLPDAWEMASFGNLGQTAAGDPDADGTSNRAEYLLGLSPTDGTQAFRATQSAVAPGSSVTLSWPAQDGLAFKVWRSQTLADGSWMELGSVTATGTTATFTDMTAPAGRAFYRIELTTP